MIIPWQQLSDEALNEMVKEFILREGTDYGEKNYSFEDKFTELIAKIKADEAIIMWSELHCTFDIKQNK